MFSDYHWLGPNGNKYGYFTDVLCGDVDEATRAGLYSDLIPDQGWINLSYKRVCSRLSWFPH